jgi:antitoxin CptB
MSDITSKQDDLLRKLYYQSIHRGSKENDILLTNFARQYMQCLSHDQLLNYQSLLAEEDVLIFNWIIGRTATPDKFDSLIKMIRDANNIS